MRSNRANVRWFAVAPAGALAQSHGHVSVVGAEVTRLK